MPELVYSVLSVLLCVIGVGDVGVVFIVCVFAINIDMYVDVVVIVAMSVVVVTVVLCVIVGNYGVVVGDGSVIEIIYTIPYRQYRYHEHSNGIHNDSSNDNIANRNTSMNINITTFISASATISQPPTTVPSAYQTSTTHTPATPIQ